MFAKYIKTEGVVFKHALGMRDVVGKEFHSFHEIFFLVGENARLTSENFVGRIEPRTLVIIPKEKFHQFDPIENENQYHRYVLQFDTFGRYAPIISEVMSCVRVICEPRQATIAILDRIATIPDAGMAKEDEELLFDALFCELLMELKYSYTESEWQGESLSRTVANTIKYIEEHYLDGITVQTIARALNFSASHISHRFKEVMHISVYSYILKKKLIHARRLIQGGTPPTEAAVLCGFGSYSGFYKTYLKYFGVIPSQTPFVDAASFD